jgi:hypothetical protein
MDTRPPELAQYIAGTLAWADIAAWPNPTATAATTTVLCHGSGACQHSLAVHIFTSGVQRTTASSKEVQERACGGSV